MGPPREGPLRCRKVFRYLGAASTFPRTPLLCAGNLQLVVRDLAVTIEMPDLTHLQSWMFVDFEVSEKEQVSNGIRQ